MAYMRVMTIPFVKMHGCGNDFVILDERRHTHGIDPVAPPLSPTAIPGSVATSLS